MSKGRDNVKITQNSLKSGHDNIKLIFKTEMFRNSFYQNVEKVPPQTQKWSKSYHNRSEKYCHRKQ